MEFLLQLQQLRVGVRGPQASGQAIFWNEFSCNWKLHFLFESRGECEFGLDSTHRLLSTNCIRLASTSSSREWESHCRSWAKSMLDRLMHCLNFAYSATAAASPTPTSTRTRTRTRVIQSISSSPTITNSASRQLRNNFTHCSHTQPELNAGNASLPARSSQLAAQTTRFLQVLSRAQLPIWSVK